MTFEEFLNKLAETDPDRPIMTLSPGPFATTVGKCDRAAAKVLLELDKRLTPDTPMSAVEAALIEQALEMATEAKKCGEEWYTDEIRSVLYAWWWLVFFASSITGEKTE